jgi:hypothetical protein
VGRGKKDRKNSKPGFLKNSNFKLIVSEALERIEGQIAKLEQFSQYG